MKIEKIKKSSFTVIGIEGSTKDGKDFVKNLWSEANSRFGEISSLAKKDARKNIVGFWGAMSDFSRSFLPWQNNFSEGLYLAGVEAEDDVSAPSGFSKWTVPAFLYLRAEVDSEKTFENMIAYMKENNIELVGAAQDFTDPITQKNYILFPIQKL